MSKKINILMVALMATFSLCLLNSCYNEEYYSDDRDWWENKYKSERNAIIEMANTLRGKWEGKLVSDFRENGTIKTALFYTQMEFDQTDIYSNGGRGLQNDFIGDDKEPAFSRKFSWYIENHTGDIYIIYDKGDKMVLRYNDLLLNEDQFAGKWVSYHYDQIDTFNFHRYTHAKKGSFIFYDKPKILEEKSQSIWK